MSLVRRRFIEIASRAQLENVELYFIEISLHELFVNVSTDLRCSEFSFDYGFLDEPAFQT